MFSLARIAETIDRPSIPVRKYHSVIFINSAYSHNWNTDRSLDHSQLRQRDKLCVGLSSCWNIALRQDNQRRFFEQGQLLRLC
jgi:hypothetical protein